MFYNEIVSYVLLNQGKTQRIEISFGIRQGCPISPKLFLSCTPLLAYRVLNQPQFEGSDILRHEFQISQFADDSFFFIKDKTVMEKALNIISIFFKASGLNLNLRKCEPIYPCNKLQIMDIPGKKR